MRSKIAAVWNDKTWRYPIVSGILSIPFFFILQYIGPGFYVVLPPLVGGIVAGIWAGETPVSSARIGWRAGLVSGLAIVYGTGQFLVSTADIWIEFPLILSVATVVIFSLVASLYIIVYGVIGSVGGVAVGWTDRTSRHSV